MRKKKKWQDKSVTHTITFHCFNTLLTCVILHGHVLVLGCGGCRGQVRLVLPAVSGGWAGLPGPLPVTGAGSGAALAWSTCILSSGAVSGVLTTGGGAPHEGTKEGALTLGTKDGALTLRASILLLTSMPSSQLSGAPLVAISGCLGDGHYSGGKDLHTFPSRGKGEER